MRRTQTFTAPHGLTDDQVPPAEGVFYSNRITGFGDEPQPMVGVVLELDPEDLEAIHNGAHHILLSWPGRTMPVFLIPGLLIPGILIDDTTSVPAAAAPRSRPTIVGSSDRRPHTDRRETLTVSTGTMRQWVALVVFLVVVAAAVVYGTMAWHSLSNQPPGAADELVSR